MKYLVGVDIVFLCMIIIEFNPYFIFSLIASSFCPNGKRFQCREDLGYGDWGMPNKIIYDGVDGEDGDLLSRYCYCCCCGELLLLLVGHGGTDEGEVGGSESMVTTVGQGPESAGVGSRSESSPEGGRGDGGEAGGEERVLGDLRALRRRRGERGGGRPAGLRRPGGARAARRRGGRPWSGSLAALRLRRRSRGMPRWHSGSPEPGDWSGLLGVVAQAEREVLEEAGPPASD